LVYVDIIETMDKIFKALADSNRRKIITLLNKTDLSVTKIVDKLDIKQPTVSAHLSVLRKAKLVIVEIKSRERIYKLNKNIFNDFIKELNRFSFQNAIKLEDEIILRRKTQ